MLTKFPLHKFLHKCTNTQKSNQKTFKPQMLILLILTLLNRNSARNIILILIDRQDEWTSSSFKRHSFLMLCLIKLYSDGNIILNIGSNITNIISQSIKKISNSLLDNDDSTMYKVNPMS